jgi:hypothetical protein
MRKIVLVGVALLALLAGAPPASAQISDRDLGEKVAEAVRTYSKFSIFDDVNIGIDNRNVVLTGKVTTPNKKDEIGKRVAKVDGIRTLTNEIDVLPVSDVDAKIRVIAAGRIYNHPAFWRYAELPMPPIHIIVEHQRDVARVVQRRARRGQQAAGRPISGDRRRNFPRPASVTHHPCPPPSDASPSSLRSWRCPAAVWSSPRAEAADEPEVRARAWEVNAAAAPDARGFRVTTTPRSRRAPARSAGPSFATARARRSSARASR